MTTSANIVDALDTILSEVDMDDCAVEVEILSGARVNTFDAAGVLTTNDGLVVTLVDGSEFQITVVRSR